MFEHIKELRDNNLSKFVDNWLLEFAEKYKIIERDNGSYTIDSIKYGLIDYFPKANKLLIRNKNKWIKPGLKFLIEKLLIEK